MTNTHRDTKQKKKKKSRYWVKFVRKIIFCKKKIIKTAKNIVYLKYEQQAST